MSFDPVADDGAECKGCGEGIEPSYCESCGTCEDHECDCPGDEE